MVNLESYPYQTFLTELGFGDTIPYKTSKLCNIRSHNTISALISFLFDKHRDVTSKVTCILIVKLPHFYVKDNTQIWIYVLTDLSNEGCITPICVGIIVSNLCWQNYIK